MKKKLIIISLIVIAPVLFMINASYIKYDGKLYVANSGGGEGYLVGEQLGSVRSRVPNIIKPFKNNQSNGFPYGTEIYAYANPSQILFKFDNKYYFLQDINRAENWGNGIKFKIKNNKIVY
ncbi:hypothetical protein [Clostridium sp. Marseille-QA1073]